MGRCVLAKRENNSKRNYVIVNKLLAKHYPCSALEAERLYDKLGGMVARRFPSGNCLLICFAEASVALGEYIAGIIGWRCTVISSTRSTANILTDCDPIYFEEEHSHASRHTLYLAKDALNGVQHVIMLDDELTTGKTLLNLYNVIKGRMEPGADITAIALLASKESEALLKENKVPLLCLRDFKGIFDEELPQSYVADRVLQSRVPDKELNISAACNVRYGASGDIVKEEAYTLCSDLVRQLELGEVKDKQIELIGTEECCYPALITGEILERRKAKVLVHAVTRTPMLPSDSDDYPISERSKLTSLYDANCSAYLYNCAPCDIAVIITDAKNSTEHAICELCGAVKAEKVVLVHWNDKM